MCLYHETSSNFSCSLCGKYGNYSIRSSDFTASWNKSSFHIRCNFFFLPHLCFFWYAVLCTVQSCLLVMEGKPSQAIENSFLLFEWDKRIYVIKPKYYFENPQKLQSFLWFCQFSFEVFGLDKNSGNILIRNNIAV